MFTSSKPGLLLSPVFFSKKRKPRQILGKCGQKAEAVVLQAAAPSTRCTFKITHRQPPPALPLHHPPHQCLWQQSQGNCVFSNLEMMVAHSNLKTTPGLAVGNTAGTGLEVSGLSPHTFGVTDDKTMGSKGTFIEGISHLFHSIW